MILPMLSAVSLQLKKIRKSITNQKIIKGTPAIRAQFFKFHIPDATTKWTTPIIKKIIPLTIWASNIPNMPATIEDAPSNPTAIAHVRITFDLSTIFYSLSEILKFSIVGAISYNNDIYDKNVAFYSNGGDIVTKMSDITLLDEFLFLLITIGI